MSQQGTSVIIRDLTFGRDGTATVQSIEFFEFADGTVTLSNLLPSNNDPIALNDTVNAIAGQAVTITIGANDSDADGDNLTTTGVTSPTKGTVRYTDNFSSADTVRYTPFSTATGTDSFTYQVSDGKGGTDTARVTVTISKPDLAGNTSTTGTVTVGQSVTSEHTASDFQDWFAVSLVSGSQYVFDVKGSSTGSGTMSDPYLELFNGSGVFIAGDNNSGTGNNAQITYTASTTGTHYLASTSANVNGFSTGTYTVSASANNRDPVASNDSATVRNGQAVTINIGANDSDADGDNLTTTGLANPTMGTVRYTDNSTTSDTVTYIPTANASGTDSFTYQVDDGKGGTDTATVSITFADGIADKTITTSEGLRTSLDLSSDLGSDSFIILPSPSNGSAVRYDKDSIVFDESYYLVNNDDVVSQITQGFIISAEDHYNSMGGKELRKPNAIFDPTYYAVENADALNAVSAGTVSNVFDHYKNFGVFEGRLPNANFQADSIYYTPNENFIGTDSFGLFTLDANGTAGSTVNVTVSVVDDTNNVFRFFNTQTGTHFYSSSIAERDNIIQNMPHFNLEGPSFNAADPTHPSADSVFRFFNTDLIPSSLCATS